MSGVGNTFQNAISTLPYNMQNYVGGPSYPGMQTNQPQQGSNMSAGFQQPNVGGPLGGSLSVVGTGMGQPGFQPGMPGIMQTPPQGMPR